MSLSFSLCTKIRMPDILLHKENEIQIIISTKTLWISFKPNCSKNKPFYYFQMQFFFLRKLKKEIYPVSDLSVVFNGLFLECNICKVLEDVKHDRNKMQTLCKCQHIYFFFQKDQHVKNSHLTKARNHLQCK